MPTRLGLRAARAAASRRTACRGGGASSSAASDAWRRASAEIERPAPSAPSRLPRRRLDVDGRRCPGRAASRSPRASRRDGRRAAAGPRRSSGRRRPGASRRRRAAGDDLGEELARWRCRPASGASAGKSRPRSPSPAAPSSASATRVQRDVAVGVAVQARRAGDLDPAERERHRPARTGGCRGRSRCASSAGACRAARRPRARSAGSGHLEVARLAGDDMDRDATGLQQRGLVGPGLGPVGRVAAVAPRGGRPGRTPCGVWAAPSSRGRRSRRHGRPRPA